VSPRKEGDRRIGVKVNGLAENSADSPDGEVKVKDADDRIR
jgi:hypothetical protein